MALMNAQDRQFASAISTLAYCNPFLAERIEAERLALGEAFVEAGSQWNISPGRYSDNANVVNISSRCKQVADKARARLAQGGGASIDAQELTLYQDVVLVMLYHAYRLGFDQAIEQPADKPSWRKKVGFHPQFVAEATHYFQIGEQSLMGRREIDHIFAVFFQIRRAFHHIFQFIVGATAPVVGLRARVWESIFTHDLRRYRRSLHQQMGQIATLIIGPSGTGKELAARAIGLSRYIPFDTEKGHFTEDFLGSFHAVNLSALSPTLIESELFGHRRGSFTGAVGDRSGWMETCPPLGTVFLDEIGELDTSIQVKLLRLLQTRRFNRLGETEELIFRGKIISATNRDLERQMRTGQFREDFFYRLCSDVVRTPSLDEQLRADPEELGRLLDHIATGLVGEEGQGLARETEEWINRHLGRDYRWPGNVRELEQCVRNVMIHKEYHPIGPVGPDAADPVLSELLDGRLSADQAMGWYCRLVYRKTGSYEQAARLLGLDRRTVRAKVEIEPGEPG